MMRIAVVLVIAACGHKAEPRPTPGSASSAGSASPAGCNDAHDCVLRSNCGCSCEAVLFGTPPAAACEESCNNPGVCEDHTIICELSSHRCGAIPKAP